MLSGIGGRFIGFGQLIQSKIIPNFMGKFTFLTVCNGDLGLRKFMVKNNKGKAVFKKCRIHSADQPGGRIPFFSSG